MFELTANVFKVAKKIQKGAERQAEGEITLERERREITIAKQVQRGGGEARRGYNNGRKRYTQIIYSGLGDW